MTMEGYDICRCKLKSSKLLEEGLKAIHSNVTSPTNIPVEILERIEDADRTCEMIGMLM